MPGDDAALLTPGRMSQRGKEAGLHTPSKDLLTSPSLSPGVSYSHGKRTEEQHTRTHGFLPEVSLSSRLCGQFGRNVLKATSGGNLIPDQFSLQVIFSMVTSAVETKIKSLYCHYTSIQVMQSPQHDSVDNKYRIYTQ